MRFTARGYGVVAIALLAIVFGWRLGERSLNAVAAPLFAATLVGAIILWRADLPTVQLQPVRAGHPGERRELSVSVDGGGIAAIRTSLPDGLAGDPIDAVVSLPHSFERQVTLARRGVYDLDPPEITQRDPLGLIERRIDMAGRYEYQDRLSEGDHASRTRTMPSEDRSSAQTESHLNGRSRIVVYPRTYTLTDPALTGLFGRSLLPERQEFDRLREYAPGDPLRNVHWKSSAKRDEFLVVEFEPSDEDTMVTVAAEADRGFADEMAAATATMSLAALAAGISVEVIVPDGSQHGDPGATHEPLLKLLARTDSGDVATGLRQEADVAIVADAQGTRVRYPNGQREFASLIGGRPERSVEGVA